jgi:hypothetical protein
VSADTGEALSVKIAAAKANPRAGEFFNVITDLRMSEEAECSCFTIRRSNTQRL